MKHMDQFLSSHLRKWIHTNDYLIIWKTAKSLHPPYELDKRSV